MAVPLARAVVFAVVATVPPVVVFVGAFALAGCSKSRRYGSTGQFPSILGETPQSSTKKNELASRLGHPTFLLKKVA